MTGQDHHGSTLAAHQVHIQYLGRGQRTHDSRLHSLEEGHRQHMAALSTYPDIQRRLQRVEEAVRLIKAAAGIGMLVLAANGQAGGVGEKAARMLLGLP